MIIHKYLETIVLQNQILLSILEELKAKTSKLELQNEELLSNNQELLNMNKYLVATAEKAEEEKKLALERKEKRKRARKLDKRDYITPTEFYDIIYTYIYKCEDSMYIISRNRVAFFLMYFTGLRVSNLLLLNMRNIKELMYNTVGTEISIIKRGRANQLISLGEDAQKLLANDLFDDVSLILKEKKDNDPVFTSEKNPLSALHRVTFNQSLNDTLKYASEELHKRLTCHSFRVTFITEGIMNNIPIHVMQKAVGYKNLQSTEHYVRHDFSDKEWKQILTATNRERANRFTVKIQQAEDQKKNRSLNPNPTF